MHLSCRKQSLKLAREEMYTTRNIWSEMYLGKWTEGLTSNYFLFVGRLPWHSRWLAISSNEKTFNSKCASIPTGLQHFGSNFIRYHQICSGGNSRSSRGLAGTLLQFYLLYFILHYIYTINCVLNEKSFFSTTLHLLNFTCLLPTSFFHIPDHYAHLAQHHLLITNLDK